VSLLNKGGDIIWGLDAHKYEVWSTQIHDGIFYSGADDNCFKAFDLSGNLVFSQSKGHTAGVTYISSLDDNLVMTGSYDQTICIWDIR
jgi:WD40 repeat protein